MLKIKVMAVISYTAYQLFRSNLRICFNQVYTASQDSKVWILLIKKTVYYSCLVFSFDTVQVVIYRYQSSFNCKLPVLNKENENASFKQIL